MVDAGMRELWATGVMHNRVRMIVGSFLVKNLLQPWQEGARWFWDTLVDADLANNTLNWQWVAGSGADAAPVLPHLQPGDPGRALRSGRRLRAPLGAGSRSLREPLDPWPVAEIEAAIRSRRPRPSWISRRRAKPRSMRTPTCDAVRNAWNRSAPMPLRYTTLDVFTDRPFGGNPLAVFCDQPELSTERMQAIAREFNLSETVFIVPPRDSRALRRLRIFTPAREMQFAGHPTLGAVPHADGRRHRRQSAASSRWSSKWGSCPSRSRGVMGRRPFFSSRPRAFRKRAAPRPLAQTWRAC